MPNPESTVCRLAPCGDERRRVPMLCLETTTPVVSEYSAVRARPIRGPTAASARTVAGPNDDSGGRFVASPKARLPRHRWS